VRMDADGETNQQLALTNMTPAQTAVGQSAISTPNSFLTQHNTYRKLPRLFTYERTTSSKRNTTRKD